jgi:hypothetical protein
MPCILLTESNIAGVKAELLREYSEIDEVKSSHLSEALARAAGFNTHAAMLATIRDPLRKPAAEDDFRLLDYNAFRLRLEELTGVGDDEGWDQFELGNYPGLVQTSDGRVDAEYKSARERAWRNIMVAGVNAGLEAGLFTIRPGDNRWPGAANDRSTPSDANVTFELAPGLPALAWFSDAGFGELNVGVAVNPTADTIRLRHGALYFDFGDAIAQGWLERERGAWLQSSTSQFKCRRPLQQKLAALSVRPRCFGDCGKVIM